MPWKETRTVDQRLQFLSSYQREEMSVTDLCHEYGISRPTAYKWIKRYDEVGPEGLLDLARTPPSKPPLLRNQCWQRGQKWVLRPAMTMRRMGVPQTRQGSPVR
ncbi:MAG: helix-turn-helix domain-containing protein [Terracidiphilus sp.]